MRLQSVKSKGTKVDYKCLTPSLKEMRLQSIKNKGTKVDYKCLTPSLQEMRLQSVKSEGAKVDYKSLTPSLKEMRLQSVKSEGTKLQDVHQDDVALYSIVTGRRSSRTRIRAIVDNGGWGVTAAGCASG
ncbi:hypothetical protein J6590_042467 [Homalodisca vitripennis]|nr:hypothetical protein J6590_042467 [Homalodisca vitripennis]